MLLKQPLKEGQIYSLKLFNGDEIIGKLISHDTMKYVISKPLVCILTSNGLALTQWMMTADIDQNFEINAAIVTNISKTRKEISNKYIESTTGIKPAYAGILSQ